MTETKLKALDENELKQVNGGLAAKSLARVWLGGQSNSGNGAIGCGSMYQHQPDDDRFPDSIL